MTPTISIIVPVYNVERYLPQCIDSILAQTFTDFELILVDDGSSDHSLNICQEYAKHNPCIRVFSIENGGASHARNYGLQQARGQYIGFIDSDDYIAENMYEHLYHLLIDNHADMAVINVYKLYEDGSVVKGNSHKGLIDWDIHQCTIDFFSDTHIFPHSLCSKLYKKELFNNLQSPEGYTSEDTYVSLLTMKRSKKVIQDCDSYMYYYRMTPGSVSSRPINIHTFDQFFILCKCYEELHTEKAKSVCARRIVRSYISVIGRMYTHKQYYTDTAFILKAKECKHTYSTYKKAASLTIYEHISLLLITVVPHIFGFIYKLKDTKGKTAAPRKAEKRF